MTARSRRVLAYTLTILIAPLPLMPFEPGTRPFVLVLLPSMAAIILAGLYVIRGEWPAPGRPLYATKLLIAATMTLVAALAVLAGAVWSLAR